MKRSLLFGILIVMLLIMGCNNKQLSQDKAIVIAYDSLIDTYKNDVINKETPKVEEFERNYKITFNATSEAMLGPIVVTVNKKNLVSHTSPRD